MRPALAQPLGTSSPAWIDKVGLLNELGESPVRSRGYVGEWTAVRAGR